jgi:membrane associated rhomboid family serine protease
MVPASVGFQCPECVTEGRRTVRPVRTAYGGRLHQGQRPNLVTVVLIVANVAMFVLTASSGVNVLSGSGTSRLFNDLALSPAGVAHGEWWRLFTAMFLHYSLFHIGFNMYALYVVGTPLEAVLGRLRYIALYLLAGLGGSVLSVALGPLNEVAAGASGAIFGLFGALYVVARHQNVSTNGIVITIAANLVFTFAIPNIDWRGHVGGLIVGSLVALGYARSPRGPRRTTYQIGCVVAMAVVLALSAVGSAAHVRDKCPAIGHAQGQPYCQSALNG